MCEQAPRNQGYRGKRQCFTRQNVRSDGDELTHPIDAAAAVTGQPITRVDGRLKVTGAARYAADNPITGVL
jgi:hypothetical protein